MATLQKEIAKCMDDIFSLSQAITTLEKFRERARKLHAEKMEELKKQTDESGQLINFLNLHKIKWIPVCLNGKQPVPFNDGFIVTNSIFSDMSGEDISKLQKRYIDESDYIAIDTKHVQQLDIDKETEKFDYLSVKTPFFKSLTKNLPHYFIKFRNPEECIQNIKEGDILTGVWGYAKKNSVVCNPNLPFYDFSNDIKITEKNEKKGSLAKKQKIT